jgi:hypothetical protein
VRGGGKKAQEHIFVECGNKVQIKSIKSINKLHMFAIRGSDCFMGTKGMVPIGLFYLLPYGADRASVGITGRHLPVY